MQIRHRETNQILSCNYHKHWIVNIVNKGIAHEFDILEYPDIVQLLFIQPSGNIVNDKILDRKDAMDIIRKYPQTYNYAEIDIKHQILEDIRKSKIIKRQSSNALFSRLSRIFRKIRISKYPKITLTKKPIVDLSILIVGTIIAYAIMKYMLHWL